MAAPEGSVSMVSQSMSGSNTQFGSTSSDYYPRWVICIDYGTTYTGAAWILANGPDSKFSDIKVVKNWGSGIGAKVPSVLTFSAGSGQKWGYDVGDSAYVIRWTKLKLEVPTRLDALKSMKYMLEEADMLNFGPGRPQTDIPRHLIRTSADIVNYYLAEVFHKVRLEIENARDGRELEQFPMDVVITHPAVWDDRAKNLTFRAVTSALKAAFQGVNVKPGYLRLASEPEACAQYTAQAAQAQNTISDRQLRVGECFIVVDAGGGTVDLVSYRIDQLSPFRITRVTKVSGGPFGATKIDTCFLQYFLPERLSPSDYKKLCDIGGPQERYGRANHTVLKRGEQIMLDKFEVIKRGFQGRGPGLPEYFILDLPPNIGRVDDPARGIRGGQLFISSADMEEMFKECINDIKELVEQQLVQVDRQRLTARTIFLSGGFSHSEYLKKRINELARDWRFELLRGEECWTAVARGGVLLGLGLGCQKPPPVVRMPLNLGVVISKTFALYDHSPQQRYKDSLDGVERACDHIEWFAFKGDLIKHDEPTEKIVRLVRKLTRSSSRAGRITIIISELDDPHHSSPSDISRREVSIDFDLNSIPSDVRQRVAQTVSNPRTGKTFEVFQLQLDVSISQERADIGLMCGKVVDMTGHRAVDGFPLGHCPTIHLTPSTMESWRGYNYYTANATKWVQLMNLSTSEWNIGPLPPNVVAIPGPLNSSYNFSPETLVIENASQVSFGSRDIEKVLFGATSGLVLLWAFLWLAWNRKKLLEPRGSSTLRSSEEIDHGHSLDGDTAHNNSVLELGAMGDGRFVTAKRFKDELDVYYENVRTELELYEKNPKIDGVDPEDVEAGTELLRRRYDTQLGIYSEQNSNEVSQRERDQMAEQSEVLLADLRKLVESWRAGKVNTAGWSPEELQELKEIGEKLRAMPGN
ncbi:chaperone protein DnaK, partial [Naviculisporaceae sp. PSN 640]